MARRCELTGKGTQVGNNVSHANNKTKRIYRPNLQTINLASEALGNSYKLRIAMNTLRSVDKMGGLDPFILKAKDGVLSPRALRLKRPMRHQGPRKAAGGGKGGDRLKRRFQAKMKKKKTGARRRAWWSPRILSSSNREMSWVVMAPPNCSASTMVTARR